MHSGLGSHESNHPAPDGSFTFFHLFKCRLEQLDREARSNANRQREKVLRELWEMDRQRRHENSSTIPYQKGGKASSVIVEGKGPAGATAPSPDSAEPSWSEILRKGTQSPAQNEADPNINEGDKVNNHKVSKKKNTPATQKVSKKESKKAKNPKDAEENKAAESMIEGKEATQAPAPAKLSPKRGGTNSAADKEGVKTKRKAKVKNKEEVVQAEVHRNQEQVWSLSSFKVS